MNTIKLLGIALLSWFAGILALFGLAWKLASPETSANAALWALNHWWAAFAFGLVVLLVIAIATKAKPLPAIVAYAVPVAVLSALAAICLAVYPNLNLRDELGTYLPVTIVFCLLGCLWAALRKDNDDAMIRATLPPLAGGLLILGLIAVPAFASNDFKYRNAFKLDVGKLERGATEAWIDCKLKILKPGNYEFTAPAIYMLEPYLPEFSEEALDKPGTIVWGDKGCPENGATGTFPLRIRWEDVPPPAAGPTTPLAPFESPVFIQVRDPDDGGKVLYTIEG